MPYSKDNPPKVAKNWTPEEQHKCISAANAVLSKGGSEQDAIFACIHAAGKSKKEGNGRMTAEEFLDSILERIQDFFGRSSATAGWEGSASSYGSTEAYCAACAIDVNPPGEKKKQSHCMLPYKKDGKASKAGVVAAAQRINQVKNPGVPSGKWTAAVNGAKRKLAAAYRSFGMEVPPALEGRMRTVVRQMPNGQHRWLSVSATATLNRVNEIDSRELFDSFRAIADATGKYPKRDFMHLGSYGEQFITGQCDFMARDGNVYVTSGVYNDSTLAQLEIQSRMDNPDYWGDSIMYSPTEAPDMLIMSASEDDLPVNVFREGVIKFISTVPEKFAASRFTRGNVHDMEVNRMWKDLDNVTKGAFITLFNEDEEAAQAWWEANPDTVNRFIEESGMMTRMADPEPGPAPEQNEGDPVVEREVAVDDEMMREIVRQVAGSETLAAILSPINDALAAFNKTLEEVGARLIQLEKSDADKQRVWHEDTPRRELLRPTYVPREANDPSGNAPLTLSERAQMAMSGWSTEGYDEEV